LNKTAQDLLRAALGLDRPQGTDRTDAFRDLFGTWTQEDLAEFNRRISQFEEIDPGDWKE
jgi:hypothetical protein